MCVFDNSRYEYRKYPVFFPTVNINNKTVDVSFENLFQAGLLNAGVN